MFYQNLHHRKLFLGELFSQELILAHINALGSGRLGPGWIGAKLPVTADLKKKLVVGCICRKSSAFRDFTENVCSLYGL